jgi:hypothetical protein
VIGGLAVAPPYSAKNFRRNQIRIPRYPELVALKNVMPFWLAIISQNMGGGAGSLTSAEDRATLQEDFYVVALTGGGNAFTGPLATSIQLFSSKPNEEGQQEGRRYQQKPILQQNMLSTLLTGSQLPFYLRKPQLFPAGTEILCRVQNLTGGATTVQVILFGYIKG